jgi:long-chain acyl-CoA synthetase
MFKGEIDAALANFARYEQVRAFSLIAEPFTVENGLLTPSMKLRRPKVLAAYADLIDRMYKEN